MKKAYLSLSVLFLVFSLIHNAVFADIQSGLIAYYPFDGNANDESGTGHKGTDTGGGFVSGTYRRQSPQRRVFEI